MSDTRFIFLMIIIFTILFTLILGAFIGLIHMNTKNVDKINEISNKVGIPCEVNTNQCLFTPLHKIVK